MSSWERTERTLQNWWHLIAPDSMAVKIQLLTAEIQFNPRAYSVWFVADKEAMIWGCWGHLVTPPLHIIPPVIHIHSSIPRLDSEYITGNSIIIGIQPLGRSGQRPEFSKATGMTLVRCILGKFLGVACHCFPPFVRCSHFSPPGASTSATMWEIPAAEVGTVGENVVR